mgnify:CR=1 FL=1
MYADIITAAEWVTGEIVCEVNLYVEYLCNTCTTHNSQLCRDTNPSRCCLLCKRWQQ